MTSDTTEEAVAEFTWNEAEYLRVTRKYGLLHRISQSYRFCIVVGFGCGALITATSGYAVEWIFYMFGVFSAFMLLYSRRLAKKAWRRTPGVQGPHRMVFSNDGIQAHTEASDVFVKWYVFKQVRESNDCYLLSRVKRTVTTIVPKRGFRSPHDEAIFRMLVLARVEDCRLSKSELDDSPTP